MPLPPANARELAAIAEEAGAVVIDGTPRYPSETGGWQLGGVDLGEFLEQYRGQRVMMIVAIVGLADPDVILCGICGFPVEAATACPRCELASEQAADAIRRAVDERRLMDEIEGHLRRLEDNE